MAELIHTHKGTVYAQRNGVLIPVNTGGLVGYWPMTQGSGGTAYDESKNGNDGTLNEPVWTNTANGQALDFDGVDDYVEATNIDLNASSFSYSVWIKTSNENGIILELYDASGTSFFNIYDTWIRGTDKDGNNWDQAYISGILTGTWKHIVVTYDYPSKMLYTYVDGEQSPYDFSGFTWNGLILNSVSIGADRKGNYPFNGTIDEVRIYNKVLSSQEITNIYEKTRSLYGV